MRASKGLVALALAGVAMSMSGSLSAPAVAQIRLPEASTDEEVPLPDIAAIERGAKARASVSFGRPTAPEPAAEDPSAQPGPTLNAGANPGGVRRLSAPPVDSPIGRSGIYGLDNLPSEITATNRPGQTPEQHVVKKGDTLTSLCELYFNDPWCWPQLWAANPHVTNPHWIFPGDVLRLGAGASAPAARAAAAGTGMRLTSNRKVAFDSKTVLLRETGFIDIKALAESAKISGSKEEKIMLATGDQAYVSFTKDRPLRAGERYSVFMADTSNPVRAPDTGEILGYLVRVYGDILIDQVAERNVGRGVLMDLSEPVERGYGVSPKVRLFKQIQPRPARVNLEARVVASFSPSILLAAENFVVISRGAMDGLDVGNRTFVVRRGDGYRPIMEGWQKPDPRFPKEVVAELWVMDVRARSAVAWVARSSKELRVGEVAEVRKGH